MVIDHDFEPVPPTDGADAPPVPEPAPRVVIQYRRRLGTMVLIPAVAAMASAVTFMAVGSRDVLPHPAPLAVRPAPAPVAPAAESLVLRVAPLPLPGPDLSPETIEPADPEPVAPEPAAPEPPAAAAVVAAVAEPPETTSTEDATREALASICAEAGRAGQARAEMERLRAAVPAIEAQARERARQAADVQRWTFHRDLRRLLDDRGDGAAQAIWDLALLSDTHDTDPVADKAVRSALERHGPRLDRAGRIALFRRHGVPEPIILAVLFREQRRMMPSRKGPRNRNEAILRAARQLLAAPPPRRDAPAPGQGPIAENRPRIAGSR